MTSEFQNQTDTKRRASEPLVSAIVLCYNHARFVREALNSVRSQSYGEIQLIVVDDCSKDDSVRVIETWIEDHGSNCLFLRHPKNRGICASLNHALSHARGKYVAAFAADDIWLPAKTEIQVALLESVSDKVGVAFSDAYRIGESGEELPGLFIATHRPMQCIPTGKVFDQLWEGNFIPAMATMVRRTCFDRVGTYDESLTYEDWDMWLRLSLEYEFCYGPEPLAKYRVVSTSMVRTMMPAIQESSAHICVKLLQLGKLNKSQRSLAGLRLLRHGKSRYYDQLPRAETWLRTGLRYKFDPWAFVLLVFMKMRIPSRFIIRVQRQAYHWLLLSGLKRSE